MRVWTVSGTTESGDFWQLVFARKPTEDHIIDAIKDNSWLNAEYEDECIQGRHVDEEEVIEN